MMRIRDDIDQKRVAELMWAYMRDDPELGFMRMLADGDTFIARPLVNEDAVSPEVWSEILDFDKASAIIEEAGMTLMDVLKCSCFLKNMDDFITFNSIYEKY